MGDTFIHGRSVAARITGGLRLFAIGSCLGALLSPGVARAQFVFHTSGSDTTEIVNYEWVPDVFQQRPSLFAGFDTLGRLAVGDLDGDGSFEIVLTRSTASFGRLHVFTYDAVNQSYIDRGEFTFSLANVDAGEIAIGDLDGDQRDEVVLVPFGSATPEPRPAAGGTDSLFIVDFTRLAPLRAQVFELEDQFITPITNALVADIYGDPEVAELALLTQNEGGLSPDSEALGPGTVFICSLDLGSPTTCSVDSTFPVDSSPTTGRFPTSLAAGDLTGDAVRDLVIGYGSGCPGSFDTGVRVHESALEGTFLPLLDLLAPMQRMTVTDVEGDGLDELVAVLNGQGDGSTLGAITTNHYFDPADDPFFAQDLVIVPLFDLPAGEFCSLGEAGPGFAVKPRAYVAVTKPADICNGVDDDGDGDIDEDFASACSVDLGEPCGVASGTTTCNGSAGVGPCIVDGEFEASCELDVGPNCGIAAGTTSCDASGAGPCLINDYFVGCSRDLGMPCGVVPGSATCDSSGEGECIPLGDGTPETGPGTDNDCDLVFGECEAPQTSWPCPTGLTTPGCEVGAAACDENGAGACIPPNQGAPELFNGADDDCNGVIDECPTSQGFWGCDMEDPEPGCESGQIRCSPAGTSGDCHIPEIVDGDDNDCDEQIDECDNEEFVLACDASGLTGCTGFQGFARCDAGFADAMSCGCDNTCDFTDQDGDGLTDEDPGPDGCLLRFLFLPFCWVGTEDEFNTAARGMADYFIASLGLEACSNRVAVDARFNEVPPFCPASCDSSGFLDPMADIVTAAGYRTEFTAIGFITDGADPTIPVGDDGICGELDGQARGKVIWAQTNAPLVFTHEIGHVAGMEEEYCDKRRGGPSGGSCTDAAQVNPLDAALDCDPLGSCCDQAYRNANDPTNPQPVGGDVCSTTGAPTAICCRGNRAADPATGLTDPSLGRCIMSHVTAEQPRGWCAHCMGHWRGTNMGLSIPVTCESADRGAGPLIALNLSITPSGEASVQDGPAGVLEGILRPGLHHPGLAGEFLIQISSATGDVLYEGHRDLEDAFRHQPIPDPIQEAVFAVQFPTPRDDLGLPKPVRISKDGELTWQVTLDGSAPVVVLDDQSIECTGQEMGSGVVQAVDSLDPDGDSTRATWSADSLIELSADGLTAFVQGVVGDHEISLELTDGLFVSSDTATVSIVDTVPPVLVGSTYLGVSTCDGEVLVELEKPEASDECSVPELTGTLVETNGTPVLVDVTSGFAVLRPGRHVVEWVAEDGEGNTDTLVQTVDVEPALAAGGSLLLADRAKVVGGSGGLAVAGNMGNQPLAQTRVGVEARIGDVFSKPKVDLRDRAITGDVHSGAAITLGIGVSHGDLFPFQTVAFPFGDELDGLVFPPASAVVVANPGPPVSLAPGSYQSVTLNSGGVLQMAAGTYYIRKLFTNHDATWRVAPGTTIYVKDELTVRASPVNAAGAFVPITLGYKGSVAVPFEKSLFGRVAAPNASITLGAGQDLQFGGRLQAKNIELRPDVVFSCEPSSGVGPIEDPPCDAQNRITNPGFEPGTAGWTTWGGTLSASSLLAHSGAKSGRVTNRTASWHGPVYDLTGLVSAGTSYDVEAWARIGGATQAPLSLTMKVRCTGSEATYPHVDDATGSSASWTQLSGAFTVPSCTLSELLLYVEGPPAGVNLYVDDVGVMQSCP